MYYFLALQCSANTAVRVVDGHTELQERIMSNDQAAFLMDWLTGVFGSDAVVITDFDGYYNALEAARAGGL